MDPLEETRSRLESQVNEFFNPLTSNERKQQIGALLENFSKSNGSWKQALYFLSQPQSFSNQCLVMYCITVIETSVRTKWLLMSVGQKAELQSTLYNFLIKHNSTKAATSQCPHFIKNKIVKILTDVGKFSWPQENPQFFDNVFQVITNDETVSLGLIFIKTISEEWSSCKDEVSTERKLEIKLLLTRELARIFNLLQRILMAGLDHKVVLAPTDGSKINDRRLSDSNPSAAAPFGTLPLNTSMPELVETMSIALETCAHLFTWIPLDGGGAFGYGGGGDSPGSSLSNNKSVPFQPELLSILCQYAASMRESDQTSNTPDEKENSLPILALNCLNELLYRKYVPKELDGHINIALKFAIELLCKMHSGIQTRTISPKHLDKGIELLCLIANSYCFRFEKDELSRFVTLLLGFTFVQTESVFYYECLEIWKLFLDHLISEVPFFHFQSREDLLEEFKPILLDLASGIVNSTLKFDVAESNDEYYEDEEDEASETGTLTKNIDVLVKIGELLPLEALERVGSAWAASYQYFENLQTKLDPSKSSISLESQTDIHHFRFVVQLIGRLADILVDFFKAEVDRGKAIICQLLSLMNISRNFYFIQSSDPDVLVQANCEIVYALRAWSYWMGKYHSEVILIADCSPTEIQEYHHLISLSLDGLRFCLENLQQTPSSILLAHSNFFNLLVNCVRTPQVFKLPFVQTLIAKIHTLRQPLKDRNQLDTFRVLSKTVVSLLLYPWQNASTLEQEWTVRTEMYTNYMKTFMADMLNQANRGDVPELLLSMRTLNDQIEILGTECTVSKKLCWSVFQEVVTFVHNLIPIYIKRPDLNEEILNFYLKIMQILRQQAGATFFEETVRAFLSLFSTANIITDLMKEEAESSSTVVEKFLEMLQVMVKDPSPSFKKFLPDCLSVSLDHIYPILARRQGPDVKLVFFQFIRDVVNFKWNYFFPGFLYATDASSNSSPSTPVSNEDAEASRRLYQIFETIGQSFLQSDMEVFRFNLNTLAVWNLKHQIYSRMVVDPKMFDGFMDILIQVLASKSHDLLKEEIAFNLYEMALVDYPRFWQVFLPSTLEKNFSLLTQDQRMSLSSKFKLSSKDGRSTGFAMSNFTRVVSGERVDLTGFSFILDKFVDDLRYYHFCNECKMQSVNQNRNNSNAVETNE